MPSFTLDQIKPVALDLAHRLLGHQYAIRGPASLVLQGLNMGVTDIDFLCDEATAKFLIPDIQFTEDAKYKSFFGKLSGLALPVEIMGNWQIKDAKTGKWSEVFDAHPVQITEVSGIKVTTIDTELKCALLMGRFSEYHKIKKQLHNLPS